MTAIECALRLEQISKRWFPSSGLMEDAFRYQPGETLEQLFMYLEADGLFLKGEHAEWLQQLNIGGRNLDAMIADEDTMFALDALLVRLENLKRKE